MTNQTRRFTAEDYVLAAAWIDPTTGNKAREFHELLTHAASTEAQVAGLVERIEAIAESWQPTADNDSKDDYSFGRMQVASLVIEELREALSKFRGEESV